MHALRASPLGGRPCVCRFPCQRRAFSRGDAAVPRAKATDEETSTSMASRQPATVVLLRNDPLYRAAWYGAEAFGKVIGGKDGSSSKPSGAGPASAKLAWTETVAAVRADYDANYFISGKGSMDAYDADCRFADPFASFRGVDRFKQNVGNLGGLMSDVNLTVTDFEELDNKLQVSWRFKCILDLPWKPVLAAAGSTTHVVNPDTGLVVDHIEAWDVSPGQVLKRLLKPSSAIPMSEAEVFMASLSNGDVPGMWGAASSRAVKYSAPIVGASLLCKAATGSGLPGTLLGGLEGIAWLALVVGLFTEGKKIVGSG